MFHFTAVAFYEADATDRAVPTVSFLLRRGVGVPGTRRRHRAASGRRGRRLGRAAAAGNLSHAARRGGAGGSDRLAEDLLPAPHALGDGGWVSWRRCVQVLVVLERSSMHIAAVAVIHLLNGTSFCWSFLSALSSPAGCG